tara:strand:- start:24747 stop:27869 length:3123 start_codon:yes stop_codon:yes gene_type:complete
MVCTKDLKGRLATLKKNDNLKQRIGALTPNWNEILTKNTTRPIIKGGMDYRAGFVSEAGDYYEAYPEHEPFLKDIITKHGDKKLINTYMPKGKKLYEGDIYNKWMKDTGMIRTRFDSFSPAIHTETDPTDAQRKTIGKFLKDSNIDKQDIVFEYGQDNFTGVEDMFDYDDPASSSGHDSIRDRIRSRHSKLKQRIAAVSPTVMNQKDGETIANAYDKMLHDPNNPVVKESYSAFIKETEDQFNELKKNGLRIDPIKPGTNPYQTADDLHNDLKKNNHIYYYPSEEGFGSTDNKFGDHPLLKESNVTYKGKKLLNNDVFRIVHDINGHNLANSDFSPEGEHNAFLSHRKMYSPLAGKALFTETAAQANWGSYNKKSGASNRKLMEQGRVNELVFADQKAGLLPDDIINTEWHTGTSRTGKLKQRLALEGGVGGVRKYWLYPDGKISEDVRWHDKLHFNDEGQMRDKGGVKITNEQGKYDNYFGVALRQHLTPAQKSHIKQELKDYGFYRNKGNVTFDHGDNKNNTVDSTTKDFGDGFAHSYEHNQKPIGSQKISKLKQRLGVIGMPEPFEDRYETVKNTKSNLSSFKIEDPEMDYILGKTDKIRPKKQGLDRLVKNRWAKQKTASSYSMPGWYTYGPDMDAIKAFQKKQEYQSGKGVVNRKTGLKRSDWKFRTDGKSLFLHDHEIAKHVKGGIQVSNAGYDTPLTYATLNALGINAKGTKYDPEGGLAELGSKKIDHRSKEWVFIPQDEIQSGPIVYSDRRGKGKQTGRTNEEQSIFRKKAVNKELNEQGRRGLPLSKTNIQPEDQKVIDKATGIKSKKPYETLATEAHHVLSYKDNPGLRSNEGNSIMLPADYHKFISNYEKSSPTKNLNRLKQMHSKLDRLIKGKQRKAGMSKKVAQIVNSFKQSGFDPTGISGIWDAQNSKNLNAYEKPDLERIWELYGRRGMGFNSITNTIEGPNNDIGLIAKQLTEIEEEGGIPALGFDNGSLEAVNVTYGTKDEVLDKLLPHQNSTGYIDEDGKLDIPDNPRYEDYLKEIERKMD